MRTKGCLIGAALFGTAALLAVPGGIARAAATTPDAPPLLPITSLKQVIADDASGHVFLDTGASVVVTSLAGKLVTTLEAGNGPVAMATDGTHLFVADTASDTITESTEAKPGTAIKTYDLRAGDAPSSLAFEGGKIWVSYSSAALNGAVGYFKVGSGSFTANALTAKKAWPTAPLLAADPNPATQGTLVAVDDEANPKMIVSYNVSGYSGKAVVTNAQNDTFTACAGTLQDMAVIGNGNQVILSCSGNGAELGYNVAKLSAAAAADYPSGAAPDAIAVAPDNSGIATGTNDAATPALSVFHAGAKVPVVSHGLAALNELVAPAGLAWTSDAIRLAAVLKNTATGDYYLDILEFPQYKASTLDLEPAGSETFKAGTKVVLKGKLTLGGAPAKAGIKVKVYRQAFGSTVTQHTITATTTAGGKLTVTDIPPKHGNFTYLSYYATTGTYAPAYHQCLVHVIIAKPSLSLTTSAKSVKAGTTVTVDAHLANPHTNRTVTIYAQPNGGGKKTIKHGKVGAKGNLAVSYKVTKNTTFTVTFSGDSWYSAATATATVKG